LFIHGGSSSWHGWDAAVILLIGQHYILFCIGFFFMLSVVGVACWGFARYTTATGRRLSKSQVPELEAINSKPFVQGH
ncbi:hypothetical protein KCV00_g7, partial [Aureobasidium melanogenum]